MAYADDDIKKFLLRSRFVLLSLCSHCVILFHWHAFSKNLRITAFHFFIYLCAVEIMPLLVIYKILFLRTGNT